MKFPDVVPVQLALRKIEEETADDHVWLTYALDGAPSIKFTLQIEIGSFDQQDVKALEVALAEDLVEEMVRIVRDAHARIGELN